MREAIIIYARFNSSRLPGKALLPLGTSTVLETVINNLNDGKRNLILATSDQQFDDALEVVALKHNINCFRGSLNNLAQRTSECIDHFAVDTFARVNGDSPFACLDLIEKGFSLLNARQLDFVTNLFPRSFPYGYSLEVFDSKVFKEAIADFTGSDLENITSYFYRHINRFTFQNILSDTPYSQQTILTIDDRAGYNKIKCMFDRNPGISMKSLIEIIHQYNLC